MSTDARRGKRLSRERILEAALALVDREGSEALTMRRLGAELDVAAMSLYKHVAGRDALLDGLAEVLVEGIGAPEAAEPRRTLWQFAAGIRAVAQRHPEAFRLVGMRPLHTPKALRTVEVVLDALRRAGLGDRDAVSAYRALVSYARGFALAEIGGFTLEATPASSGVPELPDPRLPNASELSELLAHPDRDATFEYGLGALLDGITGTRRRAAGGSR